MRETTCNIWAEKVIAVTTNGVVSKSGELVMGAGIALEAKKRYPDLPMIFGSSVKTRGNIPHVVMTGDRTIISFPTKHDWRDKSDIGLIKTSAQHLVGIADSYQFPEIYIPRPGCSNGQLNWVDVKKTLEPILDDRFLICE